MALQFQTVPVSLGRLDTKQDEHDLPIGDMSILENARFDTPGKLLKRYGFGTVLGQVDAAGSLLSAFKKQLLAGTGAEAYSLAAGSSSLVDKGILESMSLSAQAVARNAYTQQTPDLAVHPSGIAVYTYESIEAGTTVARFSVFDTATQQPIMVGRQIGGLGTASKPKPLVLGAYVVILYWEGSVSHIRFITIRASSPMSGPSSPVEFAVDPSASNVWDATVVGGQFGALFLTYLNSAGSNKITLKYLTSGLTISAATIPTTANAYSGCVTIFGDSLNHVWVAFYSGTQVMVFVYDFYLANLLLTFSGVDTPAAAVRNITGISDGFNASLFYEVTAAATYNHLILFGTADLAGDTDGGYVVARSVGLASKAFLALGRPHILATFQSPLQATYFLLSTIGASASVVGKLAPGVGGGLTAKSILPEVCSPAAGIYSTTYLQADQLSSSGGNVFTQAGVMAAIFDFTQPQTAVELSDNLHLAGGILSMYDGAAVVEHGFHLYPEGVVATPSGSGGLILAGQYQYVVVYEAMDAQGLLHQSSPSPPVQVTTSGSTSSVALTIPTLRLTAKTTPVSVVVYRTQANQSVLYRLTSISSPLLNSTTTDTVSFTDTVADTSIVGNAQLVMNPLNSSAELANLAAPAVNHVWRYRNRVAAIPSENPYQWIFSKAFVPGVPIEFNDQELYQPVAQDGGPLTCGIEMDDKNILFTPSRIYAVVGDGPAPNGTSPDYGSSPQNVPTDVGCSNRRSVVLTPLGVMFQATSGGIYLLTRGLTVEYIGAPVEAFNGSTVTAAKVIPTSGGKARRVVFTLASGVAPAFDFQAGKWSVWRNVNAADAAIFEGLLAYVQPDGLILQETPGAFVDNGRPVLGGLVSGWISFAGLNGFQRVRRFNLLGDYRSPHKLEVSVAVDSNPIPVQTETFDAGTLLGTGPVGDTTIGDTDSPGDGAFPGYELVVKLLRQKCSNVQITIRESQVGPSYGEGYAVHALTFSVGLKKGLHKLPVAKAI